MGIISFLTCRPFVIAKEYPAKYVLLICSSCGKKQRIGGHERRDFCDKCAKKMRMR